MGKKKGYTKEMLEEAVKASTTYSGVCRYLGYTCIGGGAYERVKNNCKIYGLDTSHFTGQSFTGMNNPRVKIRKTAEEILVKGRVQREAHKRLKRALIESGIIYKCSVCGLDKWLNNSITLDVDHIDGNWSNCEITNLRFLCPNCHRQTDTFSGRNKITEQVR